jgi:hypothetical protein
MNGMKKPLALTVVVGAISKQFDSFGSTGVGSLENW